MNAKIAARKRLGLGFLGLAALAAAPAALSACADQKTPDQLPVEDAAASSTNGMPISQVEANARASRAATAAELVRLVKTTPAPAPKDGQGASSADFTDVNAIAARIYSVYTDPQLALIPTLAPGLVTVDNVAYLRQMLFIFYELRSIEYMYVGQDDYDANYKSDFLAMVGLKDDGSSNVSSGYYTNALFDDGGRTTFLWYVGRHLSVMQAYVGMAAFNSKYGDAIRAAQQDERQGGPDQAGGSGTAAAEAGGDASPGDQAQADPSALSPVSEDVLAAWGDGGAGSISDVMAKYYSLYKNGKLTGNIADEVAGYAQYYEDALSLKPTAQ